MPLLKSYYFVFLIIGISLNSIAQEKLIDITEYSTNIIIDLQVAVFEDFVELSEMIVGDCLDRHF